MGAKELSQRLRSQAEGLRHDGLYKSERVLESPQSALIRVAGGREVINLCANNYLGLANHPAVLEAARRAIETHGFGSDYAEMVVKSLQEQGVRARSDVRNEKKIGRAHV